jgi:hypothetical protein
MEALEIYINVDNCYDRHNTIIDNSDFREEVKSLYNGNGKWLVMNGIISTKKK